VERPTAIVAATTTWEQFPTEWKELLRGHEVVSR